MAGQGQLGLGLDGIRQAQHRQRHARLGQLANGQQGQLPRREKHRIKTFLLSQAGHPHLDLGDDAKAPFRAHDQLAQVRPRR